MGRRPTIQITVTASLTKSSLGAYNQMLPVKFASKFCVYVTFKKCAKKQKPEMYAIHTCIHTSTRKHPYPSCLFTYICAFIRHPSVVPCPLPQSTLTGGLIDVDTTHPARLLNYSLCPFHCSYLKPRSLQSWGGGVSRQQHKPSVACPLELSCHINTNTLH